jgi:predicted secreted protein
MSKVLCKIYLFFLRQYKSVNNKEIPSNKTDKNAETWMGEPDEPLTGFSWKKGSIRNTNGLVIWSDVFLHTTEFNEDIAIILVDTQGLFDSEVSFNVI